MAKKVYDKAPLSFAEQLARLQDRGLIIDNPEQAVSYLQEISYYRLSAYFLPYQAIKDTFNPASSLIRLLQPTHLIVTSDFSYSIALNV